MGKFDFYTRKESVNRTVTFHPIEKELDIFIYLGGQFNNNNIKRAPVYDLCFPNIRK